MSEDVEVGDKNAKYRVSVWTVATATKHAGYVYFNTLDEYAELVDENYDEFQNSGSFDVNISNDFELDDFPEVSVQEFEEDDLKHMINGGAE